MIENGANGAIYAAWDVAAGDKTKKSEKNNVLPNSAELGPCPTGSNHGPAPRGGRDRQAGQTGDPLSFKISK